jgi:type II secretory pathway component GspD/PulD (secretin)
MLILAWISLQGAYASPVFRIEKNSQGEVLPFKVVSISLSDFLQAYQQFSGTPIIVDGDWKSQLKGEVTLFLRHALKPETLTEVVLQVLNDNGYSVVDAPEKNGWVIMRSRDARDGALPVYEAQDVPPTARLVTARMTLKYGESEENARLMRSFMPAGSRIIPATRSQLLITDTGLNIRKMLPVLLRMDTEEVGKKQREAGAMRDREAPKACGEKKIEKLVVEKLEIHDTGGTNPPSMTNRVAEGIQQGAKK